MIWDYLQPHFDIYIVYNFKYIYIYILIYTDICEASTNSTRFSAPPHLQHLPGDRVRNLIPGDLPWFFGGVNEIPVWAMTTWCTSVLLDFRWLGPFRLFRLFRRSKLRETVVLVKIGYPKTLDGSCAHVDQSHGRSYHCKKHYIFYIFLLCSLIVFHF
jgi:hypothetical protein